MICATHYRAVTDAGFFVWKLEKMLSGGNAPKALLAFRRWRLAKHQGPVLKVEIVLRSEQSLSVKPSFDGQRQCVSQNLGFAKF